MTKLTFDIIATAWKRMIADPEKVDSMQTQAPDLHRATAIRMKNLPANDPDQLKIKFFGFDASTDDSTKIPMIKNMIKNWVSSFSTNVKVFDSLPTELILLIDTNPLFEAAISVYRRDPKTNKVKRVYKCIGGRKDGRKVADPNACLQAPDVGKKISLSISRRAKYGQSSKARTKTKLTNVVARRVRKANKRLKKARGGI